MNVTRQFNFMWFQGAKKAPRDRMRVMKKWQRIHPNWTIKIWDDKSIQEELNKYPKFLELYHKFQLVQQKLDGIIKDEMCHISLLSKELLEL